MLCFSYKSKAKSSTSKKVPTRFIAILALMWWSGTESAVFLRYACTQYATCNDFCYLSCRLSEDLQSNSGSVHIVLYNSDEDYIT